MMMGLLAAVAGFRSDSAETQAEDRDCLRRLAAGEGDAAGGLYDRHARAMYSLVLRIVGDEGDAEDVVQEVFAQAWRQAARYDASRGAVGAWLLMMARTRAIEGCARARPEPGNSDHRVVRMCWVSRPRSGCGERIIDAEQRAWCMRALGELPLMQRLAIELAYYRRADAA